MPKRARSKKRSTRNSAVVAAAEAAGRTLGRAVNAVERVVGKMHPACSCTVSKGGDFGKYCSEHCKEMRDVTELRCGCRHPGCG